MRTRTETNNKTFTTNGRLLALSIFLVVAAVVLVGPTSSSNSVAARGLGKLLDFKNFKTKFHKSYDSVAENLVRKSLFIARALRAYVSRVQYQFWKREDYKALNEMSDWHPDEIAKLDNKLLADTLDKRFQGGEVEPHLAAADGNGSTDIDGDSLPELWVNGKEDPGVELADAILKHRDEPEFADLREHIDTGGRRRKKRQAHEAEPEYTPVAPRELPMDKLINIGPVPEGLTKSELESNNEHYIPIELISYGTVSTSTKVNIWKSEPKDKRPLEVQLTTSLSAAMRPGAGAGQRVKKPDEVFVDHRESGCFLQPRHQGTCGACYAFATTALMEWTLCKTTGKLTRLSEQYIIDCGKQFNEVEAYKKLDGCGGGDLLGAVNFVHNLGVETFTSYPYLGREGVCPYTLKSDIEKAGWYRFKHLGDAVAIPIVEWDKYISYGPMYVSVKTGTGFEEYGGGVDMGNGCGPVTNHAMLLIGHGRQNGYEYWLLRNSYSTAWGEGGYYKLYKGASERCLYEYGYAIGTKDGVNYAIKYSETPRNNKRKSM